jgi:hypothetical protein
VLDSVAAPGVGEMAAGKTNCVCIYRAVKFVAAKPEASSPGPSEHLPELQLRWAIQGGSYVGLCSGAAGGNGQPAHPPPPPPSSLS